MSNAAPALPVYGVSAVVTYITKLLQANTRLKSLRVRGEVSNRRRLPSGHYAFDLKEANDLLACILWSSNARDVSAFENGREVIAAGFIATYRLASKYQLYVASVEPVGAGALYAQLEALKKKFRSEGLFEVVRKRPLPSCPQRVAIVSAKGKGAEDFVNTLRVRAPQIQMVFIETRVQGVGAEIDIAEALDRASRSDVDLIVLARGGGTFEDLFPFNLEPVVRAIVRARHPVLTAIGHTGDRHLADDVADLSVETPSNAAQYLGGLRDEALATVDRLRKELALAAKQSVLEHARRHDLLVNRLRSQSQLYVRNQRERLWQIQARLDRQKPESRMRERVRRFDQLSAALQTSTTAILQHARHRTELLLGRLDALNPQAPLSRGYAIVLLDGKVLRRASLTKTGDEIEARLEHGALHARVERAVADA
ncbi:MAG: exodeoxyribonuclease VII large subunit [Candidatus Eremiobacteraeota bacterium]|nr:exodeoxyribonuclease VII large subunit [Candidatus Eremiobacteraeota bacterium]